MMNTGVQTQTHPPNCYGKDWDNKATECIGGFDASYTHPVNGTHARAQCPFFGSCGPRTQAARSNVVPVNQVTRPNPAVMPNTPADYMEAQRQAAMQQRPFTPVQPPPQPMPQPPVQQHAPAYPMSARPQVPQQQPQLQYQQQFMPQYPPSYYMPGYLSVPEVRQPGESMWGVLFREIVRSLFKSMGHTTSHFFDVHVMKHPPENK